MPLKFCVILKKHSVRSQPISHLSPRTSTHSSSSSSSSSSSALSASSPSSASSSSSSAPNSASNYSQWLEGSCNAEPPRFFDLNLEHLNTPESRRNIPVCSFVNFTNLDFFAQSIFINIPNILNSQTIGSFKEISAGLHSGTYKFRLDQLVRELEQNTAFLNTNKSECMRLIAEESDQEKKWELLKINDVFWQKFMRSCDNSIEIFDYQSRMNLVSERYEHAKKTIDGFIGIYQLDLENTHRHFCTPFIDTYSKIIQRAHVSARKNCFLLDRIRAYERASLPGHTKSSLVVNKVLHSGYAAFPYGNRTEIVDGLMAIDFELTKDQDLFCDFASILNQIENLHSKIQKLIRSLIPQPENSGDSDPSTSSASSSMSNELTPTEKKSVELIIKEHVETFANFAKIINEDIILTNETALERLEHTTEQAEPSLFSQGISSSISSQQEIRIAQLQTNVSELHNDFLICKTNFESALEAKNVRETQSHYDLINSNLFIDLHRFFREHNLIAERRFVPRSEENHQDYAFYHWSQYLWSKDMIALLIEGHKKLFTIIRILNELVSLFGNLKDIYTTQIPPIQKLVTSRSNLDLRTQLNSILENIIATIANDFIPKLNSYKENSDWLNFIDPSDYQQRHHEFIFAAVPTYLTQSTHNIIISERNYIDIRLCVLCLKYYNVLWWTENTPNIEIIHVNQNDLDGNKERFGRIFNDHQINQILFIVDRHFVGGCLRNFGESKRLVLLDSATSSILSDRVLVLLSSLCRYHRVDFSHMTKTKQFGANCSLMAIETIAFLSQPDLTEDAFTAQHLLNYMQTAIGITGFQESTEKIFNDPHTTEENDAVSVSAQIPCLQHAVEQLLVEGSLGLRLRWGQFAQSALKDSHFIESEYNQELASQVNAIFITPNIIEELQRVDSTVQLRLFPLIPPSPTLVIRSSVSFSDSARPSSSTISSSTLSRSSKWHSTSTSSAGSLNDPLMQPSSLARSSSLLRLPQFLTPSGRVPSLKSSSSLVRSSSTVRPPSSIDSASITRPPSSVESGSIAKPPSPLEPALIARSPSPLELGSFVSSSPLKSESLDRSHSVQYESLMRSQSPIRSHSPIRSSSFVMPSNVRSPSPTTPKSSGLLSPMNQIPTHFGYQPYSSSPTPDGTVWTSSAPLGVLIPGGSPSHSPHAASSAPLSTQQSTPPSPTSLAQHSQSVETERHRILRRRHCCDCYKKGRGFLKNAVHHPWQTAMHPFQAARAHQTSQLLPCPCVCHGSKSPSHSTTTSLP